MVKMRHEIPLYWGFGAAANNTSWDVGIGFAIFHYDASEYTSPSFYMQIRGKSATTTTNDSYFALRDLGTSNDPLASGTEVSGSEIVTTSSTTAYYETSTLTLTDGHNYVLVAKNEATAVSTAILYGAQLVVVDTVTTPTAVTERLCIKVMPGLTMNAFTDTLYREASYTSNGSFDFTIDPSKYDGTVNCYLEGFIASNNASGTASFELYNVTDASQVTEITYSGSYTTQYYNFRVRSGSFSLSSGKTYRFRLKTNNASYTAYSSFAFILVKQTGTITKTRHYIPMSMVKAYSNSSTTTHYTKNKDSDWDGLTRTNYRFVRMRGATSLYVTTDLYDPGVSGVITNSQMDSNTGTTWADFTSSGTITLPDGQYYSRGITSASGTGYATIDWVYADLTLSSSSTLKAQYDMSTITDSKLSDASGNANHGTTYGSVTIGGTTGISGNATSFDGTDDFISLGNGSSITNIGANALTISSWIKLDTLTVPANIVSCPIYSVSINTSGQVVFKLKLGGTEYTKTFGSSGAIATGKWYSIIVTFDGTSWKCYINNKAESTQTQSGTLDTTTSNVYMGRTT